MSYTPLGILSSSSPQILGPLYSFTNATFTPGTASGRFGPSLIQARSGLTGPGVDSWKNDLAFFNPTNGIQFWTVPETGNYRITATGARGGTSFTGYGGGQAGLGASMTSDLPLSRGAIIKILVGQMGSAGSSNSCGGDAGGGGASFVTSSANSPLLIAGGGGGAGNHTRDTLLRHAPNSQSGNRGSGTTSGSGGTSGDGGFIQSGSCVPGGGAGAGLTGNGRTNGQSAAAISFVGGGEGGVGGAHGGFGGGGGAGTQYAAGGGGGYSGGGAGGLQTCSCSDMGNGGGGGSFSVTSFTFTAQSGTGHGSVVIQKL